MPAVSNAGAPNGAPAFEAARHNSANRSRQGLACQLHVCFKSVFSRRDGPRLPNGSGHGAVSRSTIITFLCPVRCPGRCGDLPQKISAATRSGSPLARGEGLGSRKVLPLAKAIWGKGLPVEARFRSFSLNHDPERRVPARVCEGVLLSGGFCCFSWPGGP